MGLVQPGLASIMSTGMSAAASENLALDWRTWRVLSHRDSILAGTRRCRSTEVSFLSRHSS